MLKLNLFIRHIVIYFQLLSRFFVFSPKPRVTKINEFNKKDYKYIAIFVAYNKTIDQSTHDYLELFKRSGAYIIYVNNHPKFTEWDALANKLDVYINHRNVGWDFSMYKTATNYILKHIPASGLPEKIIYANDSVFYLNTGNTEFIAGLLDENYDFVGMFENSGNNRYHIASWLFSMSKEIFLAKKMQKFWRKYKSIKNKYYAINWGELKLSKTIFSITGKIKVLYSYEYLLNFLAEQNQNNIEQLLALLGPINIEEELPDFNFLLYLISKNLWKTSPYHFFFFLLLKKLNFPFLKKDLFWNGIYMTYASLPIFSKTMTSKFGKETARYYYSFFINKGRVFDNGIKARIGIYLGLIS